MQPRNGQSGGFTDSHIRRHLNFSIVKETWGEYENPPVVRWGSVEDVRRRSSEIVEKNVGSGFFLLVCLFSTFTGIQLLFF